jgi:hypothetical protein
MPDAENRLSNASAEAAVAMPARALYAVAGVGTIIS